MKGYLKRLLDERNEAVQKKERLAEFIGKNDTFKGLSTEKSSLMRTQLHIMEAYVEVLDHRINIEDFTETE